MGNAKHACECVGRLVDLFVSECLLLFRSEKRNKAILLYKPNQSECKEISIYLYNFIIPSLSSADFCYIIPIVSRLLPLSITGSPL